MIELCSIRESHAEALFPLIFHSPVTDTLIWDGPESMQDMKLALREREKMARAGSLHAFTIAETRTKALIGSIRIAPNPAHHSGEVGLWIGAPFHGRGYGTKAVRLVVEIAFERLALERLEARVFVGNIPSRRTFERNGFTLEGTVRHAVYKRGVFRDEWILGLIREDHHPTKSG